MPGIGPSGFFGGTGGSSTPTPENLRGGIVECPDEAYASGSSSHSVKTYGIPRLCPQSKKAKDGFNCNPGLNRTLMDIVRRIKFPAADDLHCAFVQSKANASNNANFRRLAVGFYKHAQRYCTLHFRVSRFVRINRVRTNNATGRQNSPGVWRLAFAFTRAGPFAVSHAAVFPGPDTAVTRPAGISFIGHPRQSHVVLPCDDRGCLRIENRCRDGKKMIGVVW